MKKTFYVKILEDDQIPKVSKTMINVCAWCPKNKYPKLKDTEEYTHGLCDKHYLMLKEERKLLSNS
ncbi:hypothetical protein BH09PAT1_BH09PAT1_1150 [soil metagenome]